MNPTTNLQRGPKDTLTYSTRMQSTQSRPGRFYRTNILAPPVDKLPRKKKHMEGKRGLKETKTYQLVTG